MSSISTFTEHTISDTMYQKLVLPRAFDFAFPKRKKKKEKVGKKATEAEGKTERNEIIEERIKERK
jgi:hypothetical protein